MNIHDGLDVRFWTDLWHPCGRLNDIVGELGTQKLGIRRDAKICEVFLDGDWRFCRCRDQRIQNLILDIRAFPVSLVENVRDGVQWRNGEDTYGERFVSKATWDLTRCRKENVVWSKLVCYQESTLNWPSYESMGPSSRLSLLWLGTCLDKNLIPTGIQLWRIFSRDLLTG
ncbi:hypothetical protein Bca101_095272 [Brassica carinata]